MKKLGIALVAVVALLFTAGAARADLFSVTADVPLQLKFKFNGKNVDNTVSGYIVGVGSSWLGLGYESYAANLDQQQLHGAKVDYDVQFYDIYVNLPVPVVNLVVGAGKGTGHFQPNGVGLLRVSDADLTQYFASAGIPLGKASDVHVGYRTFSGTHDIHPGGSADVSGQLISVGAKLGF